MAAVNLVTVQAFLQNVAAIRKTWPARGWSWDNRINTIASTFRSDNAPQAKSAIAPLLPFEYNSVSINTASAAVRELSKLHGGIRSGQILYIAPLAGGAHGFGLWWPWEEGSTISMRIGVDGAGDMTFPLCEAMSIDP